MLRSSPVEWAVQRIAHIETKKATGLALNFDTTAQKRGLLNRQTRDLLHKIGY